MSDKCPICGCETNYSSYDGRNDNTTIECPTCGCFTITDVVLNKINYGEFDRDILASWLFYHAKYDEKQSRYVNIYFISEKDMGRADARFVTLDEISNWYPKSFSEKVDKFLLFLNSNCKYLDYEVLFTKEQLISACFAKRDISGKWENFPNQVINQAYYFLDYLCEQGFIRKDKYPTQLHILPRGYQRIDELQKFNTNNKEVFVSMAFNDDTKDTREAIRTGIISAGYSPEFIDEIIHNHQIMPEMFRLIRECRFLIMDVTEANCGAYYEAGYALGLGKEVIITCREKEFNDPKNKPHFDIAQKQILKWNDYEDLKHKLSEWIKAIAR